MKALVSRLSFLFLLALTLTPVLHAGSVVVSNDEWMFGDCCIGGSTQGNQFALNVANFVAGGSGNILILSNNFGLTGNTLKTDLQTNYTVTVTSTTPASLAGYNAVFLAGSVSNDGGLDALLTNFVNGGGGVFLEGGTACCGGAAGEAAYWNPFLANFGLSFAPVYNGVTGNIDVSPFQSQGPYGAELFNGVDTIYMNNGNNVGIFGSGVGDQVFSDPRGNGLFGAYRSSVPEPSSLLLLGSALGALATLRKKLLH